jgi:hypothetical protein
VRWTAADIAKLCSCQSQADVVAAITNIRELSMLEGRGRAESQLPTRTVARFGKLKAVSPLQSSPKSLEQSGISIVLLLFTHRSNWPPRSPYFSSWMLHFGNF